MTTRVLSRTRLGRGAFLFVSAATFISVAGAPAAVINIGRIEVNRMMAMGNGVEMTASWTTNAAFDAQNCFTQISWLQCVMTDRPAGFSPTPNRIFIDPKNDALQNGDNQPCYDFTYATDPNAPGGPPPLAVPAGSGRYIYDKPALNAATSRPNTFTAESFAVAIMPGMKFVILGGFQWGFSITAGGAVTPQPVIPLGDNAFIRNKFDTALALDFPGWMMQDSTTAWPDTFVFDPVPAPASLALAACGVFAFGRRRRAA